MSIIYDALQKTQQNREYLRLQNALTHSKPHRRNIKWMLLSSSILMLSAGVVAIYSFYGRSAIATVHPSVPAKLVIQESKSPAPLVVTESKTMKLVPEEAPQPSRMVTAPRPLGAETETAAVSQSLPPSLPQLAAAPPPTQVIQVASPSTIEPVNTVLTNSRLTLNGVLISGTEKIALINNQAFHLGDIVDGMKIVSIEVNSVKLQSGGELVELRVPV